MSDLRLLLQRLDPSDVEVPWRVNADGTDPVADAALLASLGLPADAAATSGNGTVVALLKAIRALLSGGVTVTGAVTVSDGSGPLTVDGTVTVSNPTANPETGLAKDATLTNGTVRGTVAVSNFPASVEVSNDVGNPLPVSGTVTATGPLTDTQLRATAVPVSGPATDAQMRATPIPVSGTVATGGLTDTQLRATAVPVSGTVAANATVVGPLDTDGSVKVADVFTGGEVLASQAGAGAVLTFTFAAARDLIWINSIGGRSFADPFGGTPSSTAGIPCDDDVPNPMTIRATVVKVWAPAASTVYLWGYSG